MKPQQIFITSSGRSGTKSLFQLFNSLPNVHAYHGATPKLEKENNFRYHGWKMVWAISQIRACREPLILSALANGNHFVECTWFLTAMTEDIAKTFPSCKIVHLVRDGRDFVRSGMVRPWFTGDKEYMASVHSWSRDRFNPPAHITERFSKICWLWATQQKLMREGMKKIPLQNNAGTWRMEDLLGKDLRALFAQLGVIANAGEGEPLIMPKANASKRLNIPHWSAWDADLVHKSKQFMGAELDMYGYKWD